MGVQGSVTIITATLTAVILEEGELGKDASPADFVLPIIQKKIIIVGCFQGRIYQHLLISLRYYVICQYFMFLFLESYLEQKLLSIEFMQIGIILDPRLLL